MAIRDRGNIKWTSLMLPKHVRELRKYLHEDYFDIPEPTVDEQEMDVMNQLVLESMEFHFPLTFTIFKNKRLVTIHGFVHYMDPLKKELRIVDLKDHLHKIPFGLVKSIHKR